MPFDSVDGIDKALAAMTFEGVACIAFLEKFMPVLPSYLVFPAIGIGASNLIDLILRCLAAVLGSVFGAAGWYLIGALVGGPRVHSLVNRYGRWILLSPQLYERAARFYNERPFNLTLIGQLMPTVRIYQALPAGVLRLPVLPFLGATAIGASCWIVPLALAGHLLHKNGWTAAETGVTFLAAVLAIEGLALVFVFLRHRAGRAVR